MNPRAGDARLRVGALLLVAASVLSELPAAAQDPAGGSRMRLEVTWKLDAVGRGDAAGISAHIEVLEHYALVSCFDQAAPQLAKGKLPVCLRYLDGRFLRADGHTDTADEQPAYTYVGVPEADPPFATGRLEESSDGKVQILLKVREHFLLANGAAEYSMGCDADRYPVPKLRYADLPKLETQGQEWAEKGVTDPARLKSCEAGKASVAIRLSCASRGLRLFEAMMPVFTHPRCVNCHGAVNPSTGFKHGGGPIHGGQDCTTAGCHDLEIRESDGSMGAPWTAVPDPGSFFVGKDARALCEQMRDMFDDPSNPRFGAHVTSDDFITLGFDGRRGMPDNKPEPPPMSRPRFVELASRWAMDGQHACSCFEEAEAQ